MVNFAEPGIMNELDNVKMMTRERLDFWDEKRWISRSLGVYFRSSGGGRAGRGINNYRKKALN